MPRQSKRMATDGSGDGGGVALTSVDVYELASAIGSQFEKLIDRHGPESVTTLMPMVIRVLEHLEELAKSAELERDETVELKFTVDRLLTEKKQKATEKQKYEKELELIEESWKSELCALRNTVTHLEEENHRLSLTIRDNIVDAKLHSDEESRIQDLQAKINDLQDTVHKQRNEIRMLEKEATQKNNDIEMLEKRVDQLTKVSDDQRRRLSVTQRQAQQLVEDKSDLAAAVHDKELELSRVRDRLRRQRSSSDTTTSGGAAAVSKQSLASKSAAPVDDRAPNLAEDFTNNLRLSASYNEVFEGCNELAFDRNCDGVDQLEPYSPESANVEPGAGVTNDDELEPPVQGPINREPEEKLYPERFQRKESGIQRFFNKFLRPKPARPSRRRLPSSRTQPGSVSMDSIPRSVYIRRP